MALWSAEIAVPHWHASSVSAQPAIEIAELRQPIAHWGSSPKFCAEAKLAAARIAKIVVRILIN